MRVGFDIGGTKILAVATHDETLEPLAEVTVATPPDEAAILESLVAITATLEDDVGERADRIGVGIAGLVDRSGTLVYAPNIAGVVDFAVGPALSQRLGCPVAVENDAAVAALAEAHAGAAVGYGVVVMVTLGTGIGTGIVVDGRLFRGAGGFAGEAGHMVVDRRGARHHTGVRGPWELYASGTALGELARQWARLGRVPDLVGRAGSADAVEGRHVQAAVDEQDADTLALLEEFAESVAIGLANLIVVVDPDVIVIGGGLADLGSALFDPVRRRTVGLLVGSEYRPPVEVVGAALGPTAGAIGAVLITDPDDLVDSRGRPAAPPRESPTGRWGRR